MVCSTNNAPAPQTSCSARRTEADGAAAVLHNGLQVQLHPQATARSGSEARGVLQQGFKPLPNMLHVTPGPHPAGAGAATSPLEAGLAIGGSGGGAFRGCAARRGTAGRRPVSPGTP